MTIQHHPRRWSALAALLIITLILGSVPASAQGPDDLTDPPASFRLTGLRHIYQKWNNCGPANLTMALSYFGWGYEQEVAANWLKPDVEDKNVSPSQMAAFVNQHSELSNLAALWRYGGTMDLVKKLVAAGFPVIVESGYDVEDLGWMGHYETVVAYDDASQQIWVYDSYLGNGPDGFGQVHAYADFEYWWGNFNRAFLVIFPVEREADLRVVLGDYASTQFAAEQALNMALQNAQRNATDHWAWFNAGSSEAKLGQIARNNGDTAAARTHYSNAAYYFDEAFRLGMPHRVTWYQFGPFAAYYHAGRYQDVIALADRTAETTPYVEETHYWRGLAYAALGQTENAIAQLDEALAFNRNFFEAQDAKTLITSGAYVPPQ
jgi:tetratricopeptide (TPR) repeat protein